MTDIKDGGPAFPRRLTQVNNAEDFSHIELRAQAGMSLRDYFAGQVLSATWAGDYGTAGLCELAYEIADAMLKARESK